MMRVLYLAPWFPYPLDTGSRTRVYHLLRALSLRHLVTMVALDPKGWAPAQIEPVLQFCEHASVVPADPFRRSQLRMATRFFSRGPVVADPFPEMLRLVHHLHGVAPFDAVISGTVVMAAYAVALPNVARVLEEHNSGTRWMAERFHVQLTPLQRLRCWISWRKARRYEARLFRQFDLVTMVSEEDAVTSRELVPDLQPPIEVFPNGVDCTHLHPGLAQMQQDTLVFSGALSYYANYEAMQFFLSQVYPLIRASRPEVQLRITGATEGVDLQHLPLDPSVTLTGFVDDIRLEIARAQVSVVPIRSGGGTRLKIVEAMALGIPVVSTTKGAEGIAAQDGRHLLLADEPACFAERVLTLLRDADLRRRLTIQARQLVEDYYDWARIGQQFVAAIEHTVGASLHRKST